MKPENFVYWLQGFFEISEAKTMTPEQVKMVKAHLNLVFAHEAFIETDRTKKGIKND